MSQINISQEISLEDYDTCLLNCDISEMASDYVTRFLLEREFKAKKPDHVKLIVNSCVGELNHGFAIIDEMNSVSFPVYTYGLGQIYSCGLFIFMSGTKGHRYLFKNTSILSHQWSGGVSGKKDEIEATEKENKLVTKRLIQHYIDCTGLSKDKIQQVLLPTLDVFLSSKEAIHYGLADQIINKFQ